MRIRHECKGARLVDRVAELEFTFQNVPDLSEVVLVKRKACARFICKDSRVRLGRPLGARMKQEFGLVFEPTHFPFHVVCVPVFWCEVFLVIHRFLPAFFTSKNNIIVSKNDPVNYHYSMDGIHFIKKC
jgi:hypothetical protein